jgi:hypothetical protein
MRQAAGSHLGPPDRIRTNPAPCYVKRTETYEPIPPGGDTQVT